MNWRFEFDNADLRAAVAGWFLMFLNQIGASHNHPIALRIDAVYKTAYAFILASDYLDGVTFFDICHVTYSSPNVLTKRLANYYSVSGANETIFRKPLSRSSRATGPKMRVPRGFKVSVSMSTAALSSNRI